MRRSTAASRAEACEIDPEEGVEPPMQEVIAAERTVWANNSATRSGASRTPLPRSR